MAADRTAILGPKRPQPHKSWRCRYVKLLIVGDSGLVGFVTVSLSLARCLCRVACPFAFCRVFFSVHALATNVLALPLFSMLCSEAYQQPRKGFACDRTQNTSAMISHSQAAANRTAPGRNQEHRSCVCIYTVQVASSVTCAGQNNPGQVLAGSAWQ